MIAGSYSGAPSRRRWTMPWVLLAVCLGLCLGWQPGGLAGLVAERQCVERVEEAPHPVDDAPVSPLAHDTGRGREPRLPAPRPAGDARTPQGRGPEWSGNREDLPAALSAGARRLIMIGVSRI
ncbi:hypothetical protein ACFYY8_15640 [Streptosporangium sp. NPDC001559]|uniref:hypothetical protein n=1 Tax=Streptosporangium sp. NPDC001559 TaxID=3366187 RepID=UPI0036ECEA36